MQITNTSYSHMSVSTAAVQNSRTSSATAKTEQTSVTGKSAVTYNTRETVCATYTKESITQNDAEDKTTFPDCNPVNILVEYVKKINKHYEEVNEENKKYANPEQHIRDKYYNKKSPYYIKGLTNDEREVCVKNEINVLNGQQVYKPYDPTDMENFGPKSTLVERMEYNQEVRNDINESVNNLFREYGITIPEDAEFRLTVDPYDYYIHAEGVDEELAERIEAALNQGKNGYNLYQHIYMCNPQNYNETPPYQYLQGDREKMVLYHFVDKLTGLDIRELENRDGKFYTPDGQELWSVLSEKYAELVAENKADAASLGEYRAAYDRIAKDGWDKSTDCNLSLDYKNGCLYDIDMVHGYGPGQTEWQSRVREWYDGVKAEDEKQRQETLLREANEPSLKDLLIQDDDTPNVWEQVFGKGRTGGESVDFADLVRPETDAVQKLLDEIWKERKITPLTNKIISLEEGKRSIQGFDYRV